MPNLSELTASPVIKALIIGDSGTGKTGSIASLVKEGYHVRVLDMDNGWESLAAAIRRTCPEKLAEVNVESHRDKYKSSPAGPVLNGKPSAFINAIRLLDKWSDDTIPSQWGPDHILVVDSLTFLSDAAYAWADGMNPGAKDKRQIYGAAQEAIEHVLALLTGADFNTNVIITSHIRYIDLPDGAKKGYPTAVGQALSPTIPRYFNTVLGCQTQLGGKRTIKTASTPLIDLKSPLAKDIQDNLPIETGLATFFEALRGPLCKTNDSKASPTANPPETPAISQTQTTQKLSQMPTTEVKPTSAPLIISPASVKSTQPSKVLTPPLGPRSPLLSTVSKK